MGTRRGEAGHPHQGVAARPLEGKAKLLKQKSEARKGKSTEPSRSIEGTPGLLFWNVLENAGGSGTKR